MSITLTDSAISRIHEIQQKEQNHGKFLRVSVSSGGCSGFQYILELDNKNLEGDIKAVEQNSQTLVITDEIALPFLDGAEIDFVKELGASYFKVNNPNAKANCGCGSSFSI